MAKRRAPKKASEAMEPVIAAGRALDVTEFAEELVAAIGGPRAFAEMYVKEMDSNKSGSIAKTKMLEGVLRIITTASAQNKDRTVSEDQLTDEELIVIARGILQKQESPADGA